MNWDDLRFFLAVVRHRSLASAAKQLDVTQSTVRRRLAAFQEALGVRLLIRSADGFVPTAAGNSILVYIERVETEALSAERAVLGLDARMDGPVRIAASAMLSNHVIAPVTRALQISHPEISIEMVPEAVYASPAQGDADVAIRLRRFDNVDLVIRSIGTLAFGLYGSTASLVAAPEVDFANGCEGQRLITLLNECDVSAQDAWLSENAGQAKVVWRADCYECQFWAARYECGLALLPRFRADPEPGLRLVAVPTAIPVANIWTGVHRESRLQPRVRIVLDCLAESVRKRSLEFNPRD